MSIEQLKKKLESERVYLNSLTMTQGGPEHTFVNRFDKGFEAATNRLLPLLEKAVDEIKYIKRHSKRCNECGAHDIAEDFLSDFVKMTEIKKEFGE